MRLNGNVVMINGLSGSISDSAFNGWASVDVASTSDWSGGETMKRKSPLTTSMRTPRAGSGMPPCETRNGITWAEMAETATRAEPWPAVSSQKAGVCSA